MIAGMIDLRPALIVAMLAAPGTGVAQVVSGTPDTVMLGADSSDLLGRARSAQSRYERRRIRHLPLTTVSFAGACDERIGRFCSWYDEGDWYPEPEAPEIEVLRSALLTVLDSAQGRLPGDGWLLGQRVWYHSEAGRWNEALAVAQQCRAVDPWWCEALEGLALHGLQRYVEAEDAFQRSLLLMDPERAQEWRIPVREVDRDARRILDRLPDASNDSIDSALARLWMLSDPLYLVDGNDRKTEHYARWTVSTLKETARNPFHVRWGSDIEQLTVRFGWEIAWQRSINRGSLLAADNVIGRKHPERRDYMPSGAAFAAPGQAKHDELLPDKKRPRSLYAPAYAPQLLPMEGQLAVFPRGDRMVVVGTHFLPEDTTVHAEHVHEIPWLEPGLQEDMRDRAGLFLVSSNPAADGPTVRAKRSAGPIEGVLTLEAPVGSYVVASEVWSPSRRRAGRYREGLERRRVPEDIAALSDLLMLSPTREAPELLEAAIPLSLLRTEIQQGETFAIGWEVSGLGFRPETLAFEVAVDRVDRSLISRVGRFLRLSGEAQHVSLAWEEPGPLQPGPMFHYLDVDLGELDPGHYRVRITLKTAGRSEVVSQLEFTVRDRS
jgi:tetratricopeptide (TPR) repeat protein